MKRREFITLLGGAAVGWPFAALAQQPAVPVIGFLSGASFETMREYIAAFQQGLADAGFADGRNVAFEYRWAEGHNDRLPAAADLPVQQVKNIELAINLKTAKTLGLTIPLPLLGRADEVIE